MASAPSRTAEDISSSVKTLVNRVMEADVADQVARTSRELANAVADASSTAAQRAGEAWKDSAPTRRDAAKRLRRAQRDTAKWWDHTWRKEIQPGARDLWKRRAVALSAAGAAIPAGRELVDDAAVRLGLKRREERHWGAFFLGLIVGAIAGALVALLTTPKPGAEMREELATRAREAGEWVPIFQREPTNGAAGAGAAGAIGQASDGAATSTLTEQTQAEVAAYEEAPAYEATTYDEVAGSGTTAYEEAPAYDPATAETAASQTEEGQERG